MSEAVNQPEENEDTKLYRAIDDFAMKIGERCVSIRIIAVVPKGDGDSGIYTVGNGDFYSQRDSVREWIMRQDEQTRAQARKDFEAE